MFGLFKKKDIPRQPDPREAQVREFARKFAPDEVSILAVTGPGGLGGTRDGEDMLWTAGIELTAWMEEDGEEIFRERARLVTLADDRLLDYLKRRAPRDFLLKARVRRSLEGGEFQLLGLPEPGFDPDLKAILEEQKKPVSHYIEGLGTFTLVREVDWFEAETDWLGSELTLTFDREADLDACVQTAKALMGDRTGWDGRLRAFAAQALPEPADWEGGEDLSWPELLRAMEPEALQVYPDGRFDFWYGGGDRFPGRSIRVSGSLEGGPDDARTEGITGDEDHTGL